MGRFFVIILLFVSTLSLAEEGEKFHKVPALPGDGVFSLLRRYKLDRNACNHSKFYKLNDLQKNSHLKVGRYYYVPILIYKFNGKTIRSTIGNEDWTLAKSIDSYNEVMLEDGYRKESYQNNKVLWVPYHILNCPKENIPVPPKKESSSDVNGETDIANTSSGSRIFPIFGDKYEHVPLRSNDLRGKVYYIVSGHGGPDPGAVGKNRGKNLCEDEYAYDVALRLTRNLVANGATAYMVVRDPNDGIRDEEILLCDKDEEVWGGKKILRKQKPRLFQRSDVINKLYEKHKKQGVTEQYTVVIHVDSRNRKQQTDLFFYYYPESRSSRRLALTLHQSIKKKYQRYRANGQYHGTVTGRDLHMLREVKTPSVYIELGNIRHPFDQTRIVIKNNRSALGKWLYEGLAGE